MSKKYARIPKVSKNQAILLEQKLNNGGQVYFVDQYGLVHRNRADAQFHA